MGTKPTIAGAIRDIWLNKKRKANSSALHTAVTLLPQEASPGEDGHYEALAPHLDASQSRTFEDGVEPLTWSGDLDNLGADCVWPSLDANSTFLADEEVTFQCNDMLDVVSPGASCWITALRDCLRPDRMPPGDALAQNTTLASDTGTTHACVTCLRENTTNFWVLRFNMSENVLSSMLSYGSELLCSLGSCSSPLCDGLGALPTATQPPVNTTPNTSLPILPVPSLPPTTTLPPLHIAHCRLPDVVQAGSPTPFDLGHSDVFINASASGVAGGGDGYEYDFSFLFLFLFILAGGIGNILVCLAVSNQSLVSSPRTVDVFVILVEASLFHRVHVFIFLLASTALRICGRITLKTFPKTHVWTNKRCFFIFLFRIDK